jgi:hypothetical protein
MNQNSAKHQATPLSFLIILEFKVHLFVFAVTPHTHKFNKQSSITTPSYGQGHFSRKSGFVLAH